MRFANKNSYALVIFAALAGCVTFGDSPAATTSAAVAPEGSGVRDDPVKIGAPYVIEGTTYVPQDNPTYDDVGLANIYPATGMSGAHRTLPLPSYVEVTELNNGRTILVRISDRGPMSGNGLIEISPLAAQQLGLSAHVPTAVRVRRVNPPEQEKAVLRDGAMASQRIDTPESLLRVLRAKLAKSQPVVTVEPQHEQAKVTEIKAPPSKTSVPDKITPKKAVIAAGNYVVQLGAFSDEKRAVLLAKKEGATVVSGGAGGLYRVRLGPFADKAAAEAGLKNARGKGFNQAQIYRN
jgi:rare lipoprotein A